MPAHRASRVNRSRHIRGLQHRKKAGRYKHRVTSVEPPGPGMAVTEMALPALQMVIGLLLCASTAVGYKLFPAIAIVIAVFGMGLMTTGIKSLTATWRHDRRKHTPTHFRARYYPG